MTDAPAKVGGKFKKGHDPRRNLARTHGTGGTNAKPELYREIKESIVRVYQRIGGEAAMAEWAKDNQTEFYRMYARLIPREYVGNQAQEIAGGLFELLQQRSKRAIELKPEPVTLDAEAVQ